jgi:hypothetical protein
VAEAICVGISVLILGIVALGAVIAGVLLVVAMARRTWEREEPPPSAPTDFVAPVSSGGYRWRQPDEKPDEFKQRVARENAESERPPAK